MKISPCVVALTWIAKGTPWAKTLDGFEEPVGVPWSGATTCSKDRAAAAGPQAGAELELHLEPEDAFGDFDETKLFLEPRSAFPSSWRRHMAFEDCPKAAIRPRRS